jgi:hypothetical protein
MTLARPLLLAIATVAACLAAGCGKSTIQPDGAAKSVVDVVTGQTSFRPADVKCPSGVEAKVGGTFDCHFTGPEGPYVAHLRILSVEGKRVEFRIDTERRP